MSSLNVPAMVRRAHQKKKALVFFLKKLKKKNPANMSKIQKQASVEAWAETDCLECANCCKTMTPTYKKKEIMVIAERVGMTYADYYAKYLKVDPDNGDIINQTTPCQHLQENNKCAVYDIRPLDCSGFPHHLRRDFWHQVEQQTYINNAPRCPATLRFLENIERLVASGH